MLKEFIPAIEKNMANVKLVSLKMKTSVEEHISVFQGLVKASQTLKSELYH